MSTISALVPTLNNEATIGRCLESLYSNGPSEVIVVDGGSSDGTLDIVSGFHGVSVLRNVRDIARAKDLGWRTCKGDFILFLDADAYLKPNTLISLLAHFTKLDVAGVSCRVACANPDSLLARMRDFDFHLTYQDEFKGSSVIDCVVDPTICGLFKRKSLEEVNGFDLDYPYAEDLKLLVKLRAKGYRILMLYEPAVYHHHRRKLRDLYSQLYHHGLGRGIFITEMKEHFYARKNPIKHIVQVLKHARELGGLTFLYPFYRLFVETAFWRGYLRGRKVRATLSASPNT